MADRWEYQIVRVRPNEEGARVLSDLGAGGWRVIQTATRTDRQLLIVVLERPVTTVRADHLDRLTGPS